jgi:HD-like signal output (HDOD) protein
VRTASLDEYFIAGLLHDIGKIPMNNALSDEYVLVLSHADHERIPLYQAEREILGMDHTTAGVLIGKQWRLGDEVIAAIDSHHDPAAYTGPYRDLVSTVSVANYFVNLSEIGFAGDRHPERSDLSVFADLGIDLEYLDRIGDDVREEIERAAVFLRIAQRSSE